MRRHRRRFLPNPAWVTETIAQAYEEIAKTVQPLWLPKLDKVRPSSYERVSGRIQEYGCGKYGCVYPTLDQAVVLKVTTDSTEAEFATELSHTISAPICVHYSMMMRLDTTHQGLPITLLWREAADKVGGLIDHIEEASRRGDIALRLLADQHTAGQRAYHAMFVAKPAQQISALVAAWVEACQAMARSPIPEIHELGAGLVQTFTTRRIVFGDIHDGNLGLVHRSDGSHWVITDPGHVAVVA